MFGGTLTVWKHSPFSEPFSQRPSLFSVFGAARSAVAYGGKAFGRGALTRERGRRVRTVSHRALRPLLLLSGQLDLLLYKETAVTPMAFRVGTAINCHPRTLRDLPHIECTGCTDVYRPLQ